MESCRECGAVNEVDADGFINLRRPQGIPDAAMGQVITALYADLMLTAQLYIQRGSLRESFTN